MSTTDQQHQCTRMIAGRTRCPAAATKVFFRRERLRGGSIGEKRYPRCEAHGLGSADRVEAIPASGQES